MKRRYQKITIDEQGQLLGWYWMPDHTGNVEMDFDVLSDYSINKTDRWYDCEYLPTKHTFTTVATLEEALEATLEKINHKAELWAFVNGKTEAFGVVVDRNSLDSRYADKVVEKKEWKNKYAKYERKAELFAKHRATIHAKLNSGYYDRLTNH